MSEALAAVASLQALLFACTLFGFCPRLLVRVASHAFPCTDPRRSEMVGELRHVPRLERPLWVFEQFEIALFEGLPARVRQARARRTASEDPVGVIPVATDEQRDRHPEMSLLTPLQRAGISLLSPLHRSALLKANYQQKSLQEIAAELDIPDESVKHVLLRARRAFARVMSEGLEVDPHRGWQPPV